MTSNEKMLTRLCAMSRSEVREIIRKWAMSEIHRTASLAEILAADGYEHVDVPAGATHIDTGGEPRLVVWVRDEAYALTADEHRRRREVAVAEALAQAQAKAAVKPRREEPRPGEGLASVLCPVDHAAMAKSPVCPRCSKGKAGYKLLLTCTECGHEVYL